MDDERRRRPQQQPTEVMAMGRNAEISFIRHHLNNSSCFVFAFRHASVAIDSDKLDHASRTSWLQRLRPLLLSDFVVFPAAVVLIRSLARLPPPHPQPTHASNCPPHTTPLDVLFSASTTTWRWTYRDSSQCQPLKWQQCNAGLSRIALRYNDPISLDYRSYNIAWRWDIFMFVV